MHSLALSERRPLYLLISHHIHSTKHEWIWTILSLNAGTCQDSLTSKSHNGFDNTVFSKNQKLKNQNLIYRSHLSHFSTIFILTWFWRTTYIVFHFLHLQILVENRTVFIDTAVYSSVRMIQIHHYLQWTVEV